VPIRIESPLAADVVEFLQDHLADMQAESPPESMHALDPDALTHPSITFWTMRDDDGALLGCGALKQHDASTGEVKSMRTMAIARGRRVASGILTTVIAECRNRGIRELNLETGSQDFFAPARALYAKHGFVERGPFADYVEDPGSVYLTLAL
jgi:putative acetyltransferase